MIDYDTLFTEYDDSIAGEVLRDPLGLQVIWSDLGQRIFNYKLTSISNDIRNFTINLFHHYLIRDIVQQRLLKLTDKQTHVFPNEIALKTGLILFLENLLIYSFHSMSIHNRYNIESGGLLGSANARAKWTQENNNPFVSTNPERQILVRQISLGINGRYRTPFVQMEIMDKDYNYPIDASPWSEIEHLFSGVSNWEKNAQKLKSILQDIIISSAKECGSQGHIEIRFNECVEISRKKGIDMLEIYSIVFGKVKRIPIRVKNFLKEQMDLNKGAAGALYNILSKHPQLAEERRYELIFNKALKNELSFEQNQMIKDIILLEPKLSRLNYLFNHICSPGTRSLSDLPQLISDLLTIFAEEYDDIERIKKIASGNSTSSERLKKIIKILRCSNHKELIKRLFEYHRGIMDFRSLPSWFSLRGKDILHTVKIHSTKQDTIDLRHPPWIHDYYLNTLVSLYNGMTAV